VNRPHDQRPYGIGGARWIAHFAELDRDALAFRLDDIPVRYCSLAHVRAMKAAAGRPRDLDDLEHLPEHE
jgi:hypothetical protein